MAWGEQGCQVEVWRSGPGSSGVGARLKLGRMAQASESVPQPLGDLLQFGAQLLYEEEVPREGTKVVRAWRSARPGDGSTRTWAGPDRGSRRRFERSRFDTIDQWQEGSP